MTKQAATASATALLEQLGLGERMVSKLQELSLGNQQRVQLAASLVHTPNILILDEPFSGLDPVAVNVMSDLLLQKAKEGVPVLFSSHQLDLVQRLCDRVGIITHGQMRAEGTVDELRNRGPARYEVTTAARGWYPAGTTLIEDAGASVILDASDAGEGADQEILHAALECGPVHGFIRRVPDLNDLFKEVVAA